MIKLHCKEYPTRRDIILMKLKLIDDSTAKIEAENKELSQRRENLMDEMNQIEGKIAELNENHRQYQDTDEFLRKKKLKVVEVYENNVKELDALERKHTVLERRLILMTQSLDSLKQTQEESFQTINELTSELNKVTEELIDYQDDYSQKFDTTLEQMETYKEEYRQLKVEVYNRAISFYEEYDLLSKNKDKLMDKLENIKRQEKENMNEIIFQENHQKHLEEKNKWLLEEIKKINEQMAECKEKQESLRKLRDENQEINREINKIKKELDSIAFNNGFMRKENEKGFIDDLIKTYSGVYGFVSMFCQPIHQRFNLAMIKVFGKNLDAIIVDTYETAVKCIQYLDTNHINNFTFLPLDCLKFQPIKQHYRLLEKTENISNVKLLYDVLEFPKTIDNYSKMIGPPSNSQSNPTNCEVIDNSDRIKRRRFDDFDLESLCDEVCENTKRHIMDEDLLEGNSIDIDNITEFPLMSTDGLNDLNDGPVTRLEVLVVDGTWDISNLSENDLINLSSSVCQDSQLQALTQVDNIQNNYNILPCWSSGSDNHLQGKTVAPTHHNPPPGTTITNPPIQNNQQEDQEDGNLSWLIDFKLDSLIEAAEDKIPCTKIRQQSINNRIESSVTHNSTTSRGNSETIQRNKISINNQSYGVSDGSNIMINRTNGLKKPPFTYTELIEHALKERGELTVSAIYQWISEHFPYYKSNDDRWKNSVRHNLSINPHFRKGSKAPHGAGHLWAIASRDTRPRQLITNDSEASAQFQIAKTIAENNYFRKSNDEVNAITIDEVAAATASITQMEDENNLSSVSLEHCAEQILSGIKKEVEVQYLLPMASQQTEMNQQIETNTDIRDTDFLNPVSKEIVAEECGLIGEGYLITDLNGSALGLNIADPEMITPDHLFGEELSFQFYELASPSQLQSA